jgi:hypothetical protein
MVMMKKWLFGLDMGYHGLFFECISNRLSGDSGIGDVGKLMLQL